jgi:hypothetical protein
MPLFLTKVLLTVVVGSVPQAVPGSVPMTPMTST